MALFLPRLLLKLLLILLQVFCIIWFLYAAYDIRLYPIKDFGYIIHEFDPWFNYRAAEYVAEHGLSKFFTWYDYETWYPLGRPIGTTTYPGMQITAVVIWEAMKKVPAFTYTTPTALLMLNPLVSYLKKAGYMFLPHIPKVLEYSPMSVNDICCMIPPWFGSLASLFTGLLAYEISRSVNAAVVTMGIMAVIPAHLMRSVGGEFDNEAVAMTAIVMTFWLWLRSVRTPKSWPWGLLAGISYWNMVAAWGGYIFVLNMIGVHALMLVCLGRFNTGVHKAYSLFWTIGTIGAVQIPVVGWQPLRSLEQMGPLLAFIGYQVLAFCDMVRRRRGLSTTEFVRFRIQTVLGAGAILIGVAIVLYPTGYFGPLSARIRGLFVKHTKTGNPLVDSVAEHQPASSGMYSSYLHMPLDYAFFGGVVGLANRNNGFWFLVLYGFVAQHFSGKMSRLVLICGPVVSVACGIWCGFLLDLLLEPFFLLLGKKSRYITDSNGEESKAPDNSSAAKAKEHAKEKAKGKAGGNKDSGKSKTKAKDTGKRKAKEEAKPLAEWEEEIRPGGAGEVLRTAEQVAHDGLTQELFENYTSMRQQLDAPSALMTRVMVSILVFVYVYFGGVATNIGRFVKHSDNVAQRLANPQVVYFARDRNTGQKILIDDYLKGYQWIDQNTPPDSRVMAWWDYGYQITGIAKRTSIADGNTWNHEHIATLGRTLTSPEKKAWNAIRHWADYVLVWAGGGGDDLAKSPHLARIGNSVFPDHCGDDDPKCTKFSFYQDGSPTPMMAKSLLFKLCEHNVRPGVTVNETYFKEVHKTKNGLMRVYQVMNVSQESKAWVADPKNRVCDAPGSWYCVGQFPPALKSLITKRKNFAQLEDFNREGGGKSAYTKLIEKERAGAGNREL